MDLYGKSRMATDELFIQKVQAVIVRRAVEVAGENGIKNKNNRNLLSYNILNAEDDRYACRFAWAIATTNTKVQNSYHEGGVVSVVDADLTAAVDLVWDAVAGI